ncbi:MAG TPA: hypothetical protein VD999_01205 [Vitreimonas sp.]|nr:hypothetical protein [Vitreimonas sp.]
MNQKQRIELETFLNQYSPPTFPSTDQERDAIPVMQNIESYFLEVLKDPGLRSLFITSSGIILKIITPYFEIANDADHTANQPLSQIEALLLKVFSDESLQSTDIDFELANNLRRMLIVSKHPLTQKYLLHILGVLSEPNSAILLNSAEDRYH